MRLRERLGNLILGRAAAASAVNPALIVPTYQAGQPVWNQWSADKAIKEGYQAHAVVYACVRRLALDASSVPWRVMVGEKAAPTHRGAKLIARPNPRFAWSDMLELLTLDLNLAGDGYWYHTSAGQTDELWRLRPDRMKVIPNADGTIQAWEYKVGDDRKLLPAEDVIHFLFHDPGNDFYGMPPLRALARLVDTDNEAYNWNKASLQNRATPAGALISESLLTPKQIEEFRQALREQSEGPANARRTMVLHGKLSWQQFGLSPQEMDFLASLGWSGRMICAAFGVHPDATGLFQSTYENQRSAHRATWENTVIPSLADVATALDLQLAPVLGGGDAHFTYDLSQTPAVTEARKERSEEAQRYFGMGISPRAVNEHLGLGFNPDDCPETGFISAVLLPVGTAMAPLPAPDLSGVPRAGRRFINVTGEERRVSHWRRVDRLRTAWERGVAELVRGRFQEERVHVQHAVLAGARECDAIINQSRQAWARMLLGVWRAVIEHFGGQVAEQLAQRSARSLRADVLWDPWAENVQRYVNGRVAEHVTAIADSTKQAIRDTVSAGFDAGQSMDEIAGAIGDLYDGFDTGRSYLIARTEVGGAANYGSHEAADQSGVVETHEWLSSRDDRVRDAHQEIDGESVPLDESFTNGLAFPGDPDGDPSEICNCRCVEVYGTAGAGGEEE